MSAKPRPTWDEYFVGIAQQVASDLLVPGPRWGEHHLSHRLTDQPCNICAKIIINARLKKVIYAGEYPDELARNFLAEAGAELARFPNP